MGEFAAVFTVAILVMGIWLNGTPYNGVGEVPIDGKVIFSDGIDYGSGTMYVIPD